MTSGALSQVQGSRAITITIGVSGQFDQGIQRASELAIGKGRGAEHVTGRYRRTRGREAR
jgi:hypothetical protein